MASRSSRKRASEVERLLASVTPEEMSRIIQRQPDVARWVEDRRQAYYSFVPRPDDPENCDEQHSFCFNRDQVSFLIGGNAAGTTEAAAFKTALFLLRQQPPPRPNTPFWVVSNTLDNTIDVCWTEKLHGHGHIPECEVDWSRIEWRSQKMNRPLSVPLKPWPKDRGGDPSKNWRIFFKSFDQGRELMQARSIGGFWFSEQFPLDLLLETLRGCREYMYPGGQFVEFTPVDANLSLWVEDLVKKLPEGWRIYRANTAANRKNLGAGWFEQFFGVMDDEQQGVRMKGDLAAFEGLIYKAFSQERHTIPATMLRTPPPGVHHFLGTDWGASEEHPHVTTFGYRDGIGDWVVYAVYKSGSQEKLTIDHANAVLDLCEDWGWPVEKDPASLTGRRIAGEKNPFYGQNYADPSRPDKIGDFSAMGIPTASASNAVHPGIEYVKSLLRERPSTGAPKLMVSSECEELIRGFRIYRWLRGQSPKAGAALNPRVAKIDPLKRDDDEVDALRYMVYSADLHHDVAPTFVKQEARGRRKIDERRREHVQTRLDRAQRFGILIQGG